MELNPNINLKIEFKQWIKINFNNKYYQRFCNQNVYRKHWFVNTDVLLNKLFQDVTNIYIHNNLFSNKEILYPIIEYLYLNNLVPENFKLLCSNIFENANYKLEKFEKIRKPFKIKSNKVTSNSSKKIKSRFNLLKESAKKRKLEFNLDIKDIEKLMSNKRCYYTGIRFNSKTKNRQATIDRVDHTKGYIKGNVVMCIAQINMFKNEYLETGTKHPLTIKQLISLTSKLEKRLGK